MRGLIKSHKVKCQFCNRNAKTVILNTAVCSHCLKAFTVGYLAGQLLRDREIKEVK